MRLNPNEPKGIMPGGCMTPDPVSIAMLAVKVIGCIIRGK